MSREVSRWGCLTYERCAEILAGRAARRLGPNTRLEFDEVSGNYAVRLHYTDIIVLAADGGVYLHTGGYRSVTTKARFSALSGHSVYAKDGAWHVDGREFYEGINVGNPADVRGALEQAAERGDEVARAALLDLEYERGMRCDH